jgi:hypothetical protein
MLARKAWTFRNLGLSEMEHRSMKNMIPAILVALISSSVAVHGHESPTKLAPTESGKQRAVCKIDVGYA